MSLIAVTVTIHTAGVALLASFHLAVRPRVEQNQPRPQVFATVIGLIGVAGLFLALLHSFEAALWAAAYWWVGGFNSVTEALLYSIDSLSMRGASGLMLASRWRLTGALEAAECPETVIT